MQKTNYILLLILISLFSGCKKYLDMKPDKKLVVPSSTKDLQALIDNTRVMNIIYPKAGEVASDDFYLDDAVWQARSVTDRNSYIWEGDTFNDNPLNDWSNGYVAVYYANNILDNYLTTDEIEGPEADRMNIKGQALFFRACSFFHLLQLFSKPYTTASANTGLGIPLRLTADPNIPTVRATVAQSYEQIISDAKEAASLLPNTQLLKTRPGKAAAYALLSRVYLSMNDYTFAGKYADSALQLNSTLIDFNQLNQNASYPFSRFNNEVIVHTLMSTSATLMPPACKVDTVLFGLYNENDLRKKLFFVRNTDGSYGFKGSYDGSSTLFNGLTTAEMLLNRSECSVRTGDLQSGLTDINTLLLKRVKAGLFIPYTTANPDTALRFVLAERRKELVYRGLRWVDLRRFSGTAENITVRRMLNNHEYILSPNDLRFAFQIPLTVITATGIPQNPR